MPCTPHSLLIGATNFISPVPEAAGRAGSVAALLKAGMDQINRHLYRARLTQVNVGWRPTTTDTFPLIGPTSCDGLFVIGGTKRDGFHLAPVLADAMTAMIRHEAVDERYAALHPERKPLRWLTREAAIEKSVRQQINAAYQHDFRPPRGRMVDQLRSAIRGDLERLHDKVGAVDWGIPAELLDMYRYGHATN